jgi:hypothetical protein
MQNLYGVKAGDPERVAAALEGVLGGALQGRDSEFYGDYWLFENDDTELRVVQQPDPAGELFEEAFPDHKVLIYLDSDIPVEGIAGLATPSGVIELLRES